MPLASMIYSDLCQKPYPGINKRSLIEVIKFAIFSFSIPSHSSTRTLWIYCILPWARLANASHICSIGDISGDFAVQSRSVIMLSLRQAFETFAVYGLSLSCCNNWISGCFFLKKHTHMGISTQSTYTPASTLLSNTTSSVRSSVVTLAQCCAWKVWP